MPSDVEASGATYNAPLQFQYRNGVNMLYHIGRHIRRDDGHPIRICDTLGPHCFFPWIYHQPQAIRDYIGLLVHSFDGLMHRFTLET